MPADIHIAEQRRRIMVQMEKIGLGKIIGHQLPGEINLVFQGKINLQLRLPRDIEILHDVHGDEKKRPRDDQRRMAADAEHRGVVSDLCVLRQKVRLPHQGNQRQDRTDPHRLHHRAHHHRRDDRRTMPKLRRRKDGKYLKQWFHAPLVSSLFFSSRCLPQAVSASAAFASSTPSVLLF